MKTPKYIQDTEWWKASKVKVDREFCKEWHKWVDDLIIKALHTPLQAPESPVSG